MEELLIMINVIGLIESLEDKYRKHLLLEADFKFHLIKQDLGAGRRLRGKRLIEDIIKKSRSVIESGFDLSDAVRNIVSCCEEEGITLPEGVQGE
jgi:hypothetical protein